MGKKGKKERYKIPHTKKVVLGRETDGSNGASGRLVFVSNEATGVARFFLLFFLWLWSLNLRDGGGKLGRN